MFFFLEWAGKGSHLSVWSSREGRVQGLTCQEIVDELADRLQTKLQIPADDVAATLADLLSFLSLVKISGALRVVSADPDDDKILDCAVAGSATHIVTGDRRHLLPLGNFQGIAIVSPADFLKLQAMP